MRAVTFVLSILLISMTMLAQNFTASQVLSAQTANITPIYTFPGNGPSFAPIQAADGNLYGTYGNTIYRVTPTGEYSTIYTFPYTVNGTESKLIQGGDGNFYGVTATGGPANECNGDSVGCGTVFAVSTRGRLVMEYPFCAGGDGQQPCDDGQDPQAQLIEAADGNYYGTAYFSVFEITPTGILNIVGKGGNEATQIPMLQISNGDFLVFAPQSQLISPDGDFLADLNLDTAGLGSINFLEGANGNLYGASNFADAPGDEKYYPSIEEILIPTGELSSLYNFCQDLNGCAKVTAPTGGIVLAGDGNYYGTAYSNQSEDSEIYSVTPTGAFQVLASFGLTGYDYLGVTDSLTLASDGGFYGIVASLSGGTCPTECGFIYHATVSPALPPVVQLALNPASVQPGKPVTATLKVLNAFSLTMQQCYAFSTVNGVTTPLGKVPGTYNSSTSLYTFSGTISAPSKAGIYTYAVTCGGVESGFATLTVGDTTQTTLTATPNPVTPPASVTLTATVTRTTGSGTPAGSVTFSVGTAVLGKASLNGAGVAKLTASSNGVPSGTYPVTATYSGDSDDVGSSSAAVNVVVQ